MTLQHARLYRRRQTQPQQHYNHPAAWINQHIKFKPGEYPTSYQKQILSNLTKQSQKVTARGPRGLGKTALSAWTLLWFAHTRNHARQDWKCIITSGSHHQLSAYFWPEVRKWANMLDWEKLGGTPWTPDQLQKKSINLSHGLAVSTSPERPELIEGMHADEILLILDEAKAIQNDVYNAMQGAFASGNAHALAVSTPGHPSGKFYDLHSGKEGDWWARHVKLEEAVDAGRVDPDWAPQRAETWGKESAWYYNHCLGEFRAEDENNMIPTEWVAAAMDRGDTLRENPDWERLHTVTARGTDIARKGDETIVYARHGNHVADTVVLPHQDLTTTSRNLQQIMNKDRGTHITVDGDGLGIGVYDNLISWGIKAEAFHGNAATPGWTDKTGYQKAANARAAAWWNLREMLDPENPNPISLPRDDKLMGDLTAVRRRSQDEARPYKTKYHKDGSPLIELEEKAITSKRIQRSPDRGDALAYCFWSGEYQHPTEWVGTKQWAAQKAETLNWARP